VLCPLNFFSYDFCHHPVIDLFSLSNNISYVGSLLCLIIDLRGHHLRNTSLRYINYHFLNFEINCYCYVRFSIARIFVILHNKKSLSGFVTLGLTYKFVIFGVARNHLISDALFLTRTLSARISF
jgi:hypothetical protein